MMTVLEIIDTAVKIGLGAIIGGVTSYVLARRAEKHEIDKNTRGEERSTSRELAMKLEQVESFLNEALLQIHNEDLSLAKQKMMPAGEEIYCAVALANLIGDDELVEVLDKMARQTEKMYNELAYGEPSESQFVDYGFEYNRLKKLAYPMIRKIYSKGYSA
jgi:hypothetical protein